MVKKLIKARLHRTTQRIGASNCNFKISGKERPSRWWRTKTWRSPSSPQMHQKHIYMWNNYYKTPTDCWQKISDFPKGKKLTMYLVEWLTGSWCLAGYQACASEVVEPSSGHWSTRDLPAPRNIKRRKFSQRSPSQR